MDVAELLRQVTKVLPGGREERPGQVQMAQAVAQAVKLRRHLVVQAGTGTGKSLAYLVPAIRAGRRVVVATATKALQDQLASKDLPLLASVRPPGSFSFAVLKGRSNYLCKQRSAEMGVGSGASGALPVGTAQALSLQFDDGHAESLQSDDGNERPPTGGTRLTDQLRLLAEWGEHSPTGDCAELDFEPDPRAWAALSVGPRECPGAFRCPSGSVCFTERARSRAAAADVVVVNTHLYATHIASEGAVLPEHDILILDEAHEVEDIMTSGLGVELTPGRIRAVAQAARGLARREHASAVEALAEAANQLESTLRPLVGARVLSEGAGDTSVRNRQGAGGDDLLGRRPAAGAAGSASPLELAEPHELSLGLKPPGGSADRRDSVTRRDSQPAGPDSGGELARLLAVIDSRLSTVTQALRAAERSEQHEDPDTASRRIRALQSTGHLAEDVREIAGADTDHVAWVETSGPGAGQVSLKLAPVEIGPMLSERLWPNVTAVLTSATIPPLAERRLGLPPEKTDRLDVQSPFPFREHALLYCATKLPDRRSPGAEAAIAEELAALIAAAGGRTLALFTSWRAMSATYDRLKTALPFPLFAQGDLPKPKLLEAFSADEAACLFATVSFWQGVDIPGRTLSLVALDRLPFPRPDDPLFQARRERAGDRAFSLVDLPRAAMLLAQGAGRLIRSATDTGVVAVLDRRLATAGYGRVLRASLPPMRWTTDRRVVVAFLERATG
jgi:ATP-dependent DNA helicase DinG